MHGPVTTRRAARRRPAPGAAATVLVLCIAAAAVLSVPFIGPTPKPAASAERLVFPVAGSTSYIDSFGTPRMAGTPDEHLNTGVDIFATSGAAVSAVAAGRIVASGIDHRSIYGHSLVLESTAGDRYRYAGLAADVTVGRTVAAGEQMSSVALTTTGWRPRLFLERTVLIGSTWTPVNVYQQLRVAEGRSIGGIVLRDAAGTALAADVAAGFAALHADAGRAGFRLDVVGYRSPEEHRRLRRAACGPTRADIEDRPAHLCSPPVPKPGEDLLGTGRAVELRLATANGDTPRLLRRTDRAYAWLLVHGPPRGWVNPTAAAPWRWEFGPGRLA